MPKGLRLAGRADEKAQHLAHSSITNPPGPDELPELRRCTSQPMFFER
jgi:hypothetical protein